MELLEYAIWQRLPHLTLEELQHMLHLTPLEQTVAGQQLISRSLQQGLTEGVQQGVVKGLKQGREQGELIGKIQLLQRLLKQRVTPKNQLLPQSRYQLKQLLKQLEAQL